MPQYALLFLLPFEFPLFLSQVAIQSEGGEVNRIATSASRLFFFFPSPLFLSLLPQQQDCVEACRGKEETKDRPCAPPNFSLLSFSPKFPSSPPSFFSETRNQHLDNRNQKKTKNKPTEQTFSLSPPPPFFPSGRNKRACEEVSPPPFPKFFFPSVTVAT